MNSIHILMLVLFLLPLSGLTQDQTPNVFLEQAGYKIECKFSHLAVDSSKENANVEVYSCGKDNTRSLLIKYVQESDKKSPSWHHYSVENGKFSQGKPSKVKSLSGETISIYGNRKELEIDLLKSAMAHDRFKWDLLIPKSDKLSKEFLDVQESITNFVANRIEVFERMDEKEKEFYFTDTDQKKVKCKRFDSAEGKSCRYFQCPNETIVFLNHNYLSESYSLKFTGEGGAQSRLFTSVEYPGLGKVEIGHYENDYSEDNFYEQLTYQNPIHLKDCQDPELNNIQKRAKAAYQSLVTKYDELPYKILVDNINGVFKTIYTLGGVPDNYCQYEDTYFNKKNMRLRDVRKLLKNQSRNKVYDLKDAQKAFNFFKDQQDIPWKFADDGCYARAHVASMRVEEELNLDMDKVWLFGEGLSPKSNPEVNWFYHVAASINVKDQNGNIQPMIIDPSLADGPLSIEEWSALFSPSKNKPLRGSYNSLRHGIKVRPTYTITGNEVYNIAEITTGEPMSDYDKMSSAKDTLKMLTKELEERNSK